MRDLHEQLQRMWPDEMLHEARSDILLQRLEHHRDGQVEPRGGLGCVVTGDVHAEDAQLAVAEPVQVTGRTEQHDGVEVIRRLVRTCQHGGSEVARGVAAVSGGQEDGMVVAVGKTDPGFAEHRRARSEQRVAGQAGIFGHDLRADAEVADLDHHAWPGAGQFV